MSKATQIEDEVLPLSSALSLDPQSCVSCSLARAQPIPRERARRAPPKQQLVPT